MARAAKDNDLEGLLVGKGLQIINKRVMKMKKNKNRKRFKKRISEIIKLADKLTSVISILDGLDKWRWLF